MEPAIAEEVQINLESGQGKRKNFKNEILKIVFVESFYLTIPEGFRIINNSADWLNEALQRERQVEALKEFGFSGEIKTVIYRNNLGCFRAEVVSFLDWLAIWALFASRKNKRAAKVLRLFAEKGLDARIEEVKQNYSSQIRHDSPTSKQVGIQSATCR